MRAPGLLLAEHHSHSHPSPPPPLTDNQSHFDVVFVPLCLLVILLPPTHGAASFSVSRLFLPVRLPGGEQVEAQLNSSYSKRISASTLLRTLSPIRKENCCHVRAKDTRASGDVYALCVKGIHLKYLCISRRSVTECAPYWSPMTASWAPPSTLHSSANGSKKQRTSSRGRRATTWSWRCVIPTQALLTLLEAPRYSVVFSDLHVEQRPLKKSTATLELLILQSFT